MINYSVPIKRLCVILTTVSFLVACKPPTVFTDDPNYEQQANTIQDAQERAEVLKRYIPCEIPGVNTSEVKSLDIEINVDGSDSMLGYVKPINSRYIETLEMLDSSFSSENNVSYYRVGTRPNDDQEGRQKLSDRQEFRKAQSSEFYGANPQQFPRVTSSLDKAIIPLKNKDKFVILVTDLEQNDGDLINLKTQIEKNYLQDNAKNYAIGILGINSEFTGQVTPVNSNFRPFQHQENRPFYVILIAPYPNLMEYYKQIKNSNKDILKNSEISIFYPGSIVENAASLNNSTLPDELDKPESLQYKKVAIEVKKPPYELIEIPQRIETSELSIPYSLPLTFLEKTLLPDPDSIETRYTLKTYDPVTKSFSKKSENSAIELKDMKLKDNTLHFNTIINPQNFSTPGIYLLTIDTVVNNFKDETWWEQWDWKSRENDKDGSKTYGLLNLMQNLKQTTLNLMKNSEDKNVIGRFCYGIQKN
ncbi:hypothetical protein [Aphanothece sacrum]|uniref:VWFA domain-containing protein n=1 Tax=Aphanothece sacrum FPU1 TaxID=1920663 RepID=A0A401IC50_APHSA|nr:hypothetical protein [Aphanothece sacrum]GBF78801.1 hypothetical protein AsFPU1_0191 [Aphanothece sacrum FPU1]GBF83033.1 hypothetical protein AsFPU3_0071 [Aphanothece sacrum FPU3]